MDVFCRQNGGYGTGNCTDRIKSRSKKIKGVGLYSHLLTKVPAFFKKCGTFFRKVHFCSHICFLYVKLLPIQWTLGFVFRPSFILAVPWNGYLFCSLWYLFSDILRLERILHMPQKHYFTEEEKAELLSNPYTSYLSACRVFYSHAFKQLVIDNINKKGMTSTKVFRLAGYRDDLFSHTYRKRIVKRIRMEAESPEGLQEPVPPKKKPVKKKHIDTEFRELEKRVQILEQQLEFLKKSQHLQETGQLIPPRNSS